jgi:hypothetical protein
VAWQLRRTVPGGRFGVVLYEDLAALMQETVHGVIPEPHLAGDLLGSESFSLPPNRTREEALEQLERLVEKAVAAIHGVRRKALKASPRTPYTPWLDWHYPFETYNPTRRSGLRGRLRINYPFPTGSHRFRVEGEGLPHIKTLSPPNDGCFRWVFAFVAPDPLPSYFIGSNWDLEEARRMPLV